MKFSHSSSSWRAICAGVEVISRGLRWRLGNGQEINFWTDSWSPVGPLYQYVLLPLPQDRLLDKVCSYITANDCDMQFLNRMLPTNILHSLQYFSSDINELVTDCRYWAFSANGQYTVSSAYQAINPPPRWMGTFLWKMKIPPRTKTFLWLLLHNKLLTNDYRRRCNLSISAQCFLCLNGEETLEHTFRDCSNALAIWTSFSFPLQFTQSFHLPLQDWFLTNLKESSQSWQGLQWNNVFAIFLWAIWKVRCSRMFAMDDQDPRFSATHIYQFYKEWFAANTNHISTTPPRSQDVIWQRPMRGTLKLNVDAG